MDALPEMQTRKTKIDMHVQIASKILAEINKRELNNLQDWEDEIMGNSGTLSAQTMSDLIRYLKRETASEPEFTDKLRVLAIIVLCASDRNLFTEALAAVQSVNPEEMTQQTVAFLQALAK